MKPLQPITNPMGNPLLNDHYHNVASMRYGITSTYEQLRGVRYKTGGHYEPDKSFQRQEIPLGALVKLNPRLLK